MTTKGTIAFSAIVLFMFIGPAPSFGQWSVDFENGLAVSGYNDVRIPGDTGTLFSLSEELTTDPGYYFHVRLGYRWKNRHTISVFAAPLTLHAAGSVDRTTPVFDSPLFDFLRPPN